MADPKETLDELVDVAPTRGRLSLRRQKPEDQESAPSSMEEMELGTERPDYTAPDPLARPPERVLRSPTEIPQAQVDQLQVDEKLKARPRASSEIPQAQVDQLQVDEKLKARPRASSEVPAGEVAQLQVDDKLRSRSRSTSEIPDEDLARLQAGDKLKPRSRATSEIPGETARRRRAGSADAPNEFPAEPHADADHRIPLREELSEAGGARSTLEVEAEGPRRPPVEVRKPDGSLPWTLPDANQRIRLRTLAPGSDVEALARIRFREELPPGVENTPSGLDAAVEVRLPDRPAPRAKAPPPPEDQEEEHPAPPPTSLLVRDTILATLAEDARCAHCGQPLRWIRESKEVRLDMTHLQAGFTTIRREVLDCRVCRDRPPVVAGEPAFLLPDMAGNGLLAQVVVSRFADHMSLQALADVLSAWEPAMTSQRLAGWIRKAGGAVQPLHALLATTARSGKADSDKEGVPSVDGGRKPRAGQVRVTRWGGGVVYGFTPTAGPARGEAWVEKPDLEGIAARKTWQATLGRNREGRLAFVRQHFFRALPRRPEEARRLLTLFQRAWTGERPGADEGALKDLFARIHGNLATARERFERPGDALEMGVSEALGLWEQLVPGGREPRHRHGLKLSMEEMGARWFFEEQEGGVDVALAFYSLVESCRSLGLWPWEYLKDLFGAVAANPDLPWAEWTPQSWGLRMGHLTAEDKGT